MILLLGLGCAPEIGEPAWAMDTLRLDPVGDGVVGVQSWVLFDAAWADGRRPARQVCSVLVEVAGEPTGQGCEACEARFRVQVAVIEHDCPRGTVRALPVLTALDGVGVGEVPEELADDLPFPGAVGAWARYGGRWVPFGWAWPAGAEDGQVPAQGWDGDASFDLWPAYAWSLAGQDIGVAVDADDRRRSSDLDGP